MPTLLIKNIQTLVTMDAARRELRNGALLVRDNVIEQVGTTPELPQIIERHRAEGRRAIRRAVREWARKKAGEST